MSHSHSFKFALDAMPEMPCEGCSLVLRLATQAESVHVRDTGDWAPDGPLEMGNRSILVPLDYDIWEGVSFSEAP